MLKKLNPTLLAAPLLCCAITQVAHAADPVTDDQWRGIGTLSLVSASGNTESSTINLKVDMDRQSPIDKWSAYLQDLNSKATTTVDGVEETNTTAALWRVGGRYDRNFDPTIFGFVGLGLEHNQETDLSLREAVNFGAGYHWIKNDTTTLDVDAGLSLRRDNYSDPGVMINNELKTTYDATEALLGEDLSYKFNDHTQLKQSFVAYPNLTTSGKYRSIFDISLSVAMTKTLSLTASFQDRYDSLAEAPIKPNDTLLMVGISLNLGPDK